MKRHSRLKIEAAIFLPFFYHFTYTKPASPLDLIPVLVYNISHYPEGVDHERYRQSQRRTEGTPPETI